MFHMNHESRSIGGHIYFVPSYMMVFASKMPTLRAFRALLKSFKKLGEVVSTSEWHHMQGLGPPDHVTNVRLMAHHPKSRGCNDAIDWYPIYLSIVQNEITKINWYEKYTCSKTRVNWTTQFTWHVFNDAISKALIWGSIAWKKHGRNPAKGSCD